MLKYTNGDGWNEGCGCSGKPMSKAALPSDAVPVIFNVPVARYVPINGNRYHAKPGLIAVDMRESDVVALGTKARLAEDAELTKMTGYRSRA